VVEAKHRLGFLGAHDAVGKDLPAQGQHILGRDRTRVADLIDQILENGSFAHGAHPAIFEGQKGLGDLGASIPNRGEDFSNSEARGLGPGRLERALDKDTPEGSRHGATHVARSAA
jgi:hypothetical protein